MAFNDIRVGVTSQIERVRSVSQHATMAPLIVRGVIFFGGFIAMMVGMPPSIALGPGALALALLAAAPAAAPRTAIPTVVIAIIVFGWMASSGVLGTQINLWRLTVVGIGIYVVHAGSALAAVLPYDAVISRGVFGPFVIRLGAAAAFTVGIGLLVLTIPSFLGGGRMVAATLAGFVLMLTLAIYLSFLGNRRQ